MNEVHVVRALLQFVARNDGTARPRATYQLSWLASKVAPNAKNIADLEKGRAMAKMR